MTAAAVIAGVLLFSTTASGQVDGSYDALVDQYARGDAEAAVTMLAVWPAARIASTLQARARSMTNEQLRAAVMLHTDVALAMMAADSAIPASDQINNARRLLALMRPVGHGDERTQRFESHWYAFVASMFTSRAMLDYADRFVRDGLTLYPRDGILYLARGKIQEMRVVVTDVDPRNGGQVARQTRALEAAAADYRRAIDYDVALASAHLHLGWVHFIGRDNRARENLDAALSRATEQADRYLAHLFLGALAERDNRLDDAWREYQTAREIGPECQTPFVALSRVEEALGHSARARDIAREFAALTKTVEDPWWDYHFGGFDQPTLRLLRHDAQSR